MINLRKVASYDSKLHRFADYFHEDDVESYVLFCMGITTGFALILGLGIGLIAGSWMYFPETSQQTEAVVQKEVKQPRFKEVSRDLVVGETTYIIVAKDTYTNECYAFTQYGYGGSGMAYSDLKTVRCKE